MIYSGRLHWNISSPKAVLCYAIFAMKGTIKSKLNSQQSILNVENVCRDSVYILLFSHTLYNKLRVNLILYIKVYGCRPWPPNSKGRTQINPLALEQNIYSLGHLLCNMWIFYEPRRVKLGNIRHCVEE